MSDRSITRGVCWLHLICAGVYVTGCAINIPRSSVTQWPIQQRAMYYHQPLPHRVVVVSLLDQRPINERKGKKAPGMFLLFWNRRIGDYYTSDQAFGDNVSTQLTQQLALYLKSANVFQDITHEPTSEFLEIPPVRVQQLAKTHGVDYVLGGELEHFFGTQHQQMTMYMLPLYFINAWGWTDSKTLPWGQTTIRFSVYDGATGEMLWRQRFQAQYTSPREKDSMSNAALESFTILAGDLALQLRQLPYSTASPSAQEG